MVTAHSKSEVSDVESQTQCRPARRRVLRNAKLSEQHAGLQSSGDGLLDHRRSRARPGRRSPRASEAGSSEAWHRPRYQPRLGSPSTAHLNPSGQPTIISTAGLFFFIFQGSNPRRFIISLQNGGDYVRAQGGRGKHIQICLCLAQSSY